jgi:hypothetical protein
MQVSNLKLVSGQFAYRTESITFSQDGSCYINIQIGLLTGPVDNRAFEPVASQSHHLNAEEMQSVTVELTEQEPLRVVVETALEIKLREKGVLKL